MKTILALDLGKFKTSPCLLTQNAGTVPAYILAHSSPVGFFSAQGPLAGRFKDRPCFYPSSQGDLAYVSLSVLENRPDLGRTVRLGRTIQCSRRASVPRAALRSALGYLLLPLWGGRIGSRPEARGQRREGTAKQPENFGAILRRYPRITMHVASRKTRGLSPRIS